MSQYNFKCSASINNPYKINILMDKYIDLTTKSAFIQLNTIYFPNNFINNYNHNYFTCYFKKGSVNEVKRVIPIPQSMYSLESCLKTILICAEESFADKSSKFNLDFEITNTKEGFSCFYINPAIDSSHADYLLEFNGSESIGDLIGYKNYTMPPYSGVFPITKIYKHYQNIPCDQNFITSPIFVKIDTNINVSTNANRKNQEPVAKENIVYMFNSAVSPPFSMLEKDILTDARIQILDTEIKNLSIEFLDQNFQSLRPLDDSALSSIDYSIYIE